MAQAAEWTEAEFETLLQAEQRDSQELARLLDNRTPGAAAVVQQGVHAFHSGQDASMLSPMMVKRLKDRSRPVNCPVCGKVVIG